MVGFTTAQGIEIFMNKGAWKDDIHIFSHKDREILYQVNTGIFFEIDGLVKDILVLAKDYDRDEIISTLSDQYGLNDVLEVIGELEAHDILTFAPESPVPEVPDASVRGASAPLDITLHISHGCNIKCTYCFALGGSYGEKPTMMDFATAKQSIDWLLSESAEAGSCNVTFFGGEPLLNLDLMKQTVAYAKKEAEARDITITFGITTNGTLLSGEALAFIMKENIGIVLSLDGDAETHNQIRTFHDGSDTYDVIAENARKASAQNPERVKIRATMTSKNLDMKGIAEHLSQFGAGSVEVASTVEHPKSPTAICEGHLPELKKHLKRLSEEELAGLMAGKQPAQAYFLHKMQQVLNPQKKEYGCGGGKTFFGVSVDGAIYFCSAFASIPEFKMGDVFNGLDPAKKQQFDRDLHVDRRETCKSCWARYLCGGGCVYDAQMVNGTALEPNPVACEQIRYTYELAMGMALELQEENTPVFDALCGA